MSFNFAINRVACAQICRANGIDRCSPVALDSLSDIMIRFMTLLAAGTMKAAAIKGAQDPAVDDVVFALEELHMLPPHLDPSDCEGVVELLAWLRGPGPQRAMQVSRTQQQALSALGAAQGAALAQQGSHEMQGSGARVDSRADWLRQMVEKQVLMGHDQKFQSTIFGENKEGVVEVEGSEFLEGVSSGTAEAARDVLDGRKSIEDVSEAPLSEAPDAPDAPQTPQTVAQTTQTEASAVPSPGL